MAGGQHHTFYFDYENRNNHPRNLCPFRHLIRVMRRHDLTKKNYLPTYLNRAKSIIIKSPSVCGYARARLITQIVQLKKKILSTFYQNCDINHSLFGRKPWAVHYTIPRLSPGGNILFIMVTNTFAKEVEATLPSHFLNEHTVPQSPSTELPACQIEWRTHYNLRKDIKRKRTLTFRHCPNHPTPLWTLCDGPETCVEFSCGFSVSLLWWMLYHNLTSVTDQPTYLRTYMGRW